MLNNKTINSLYHQKNNQILCNNADAHKTHHESLPPEKKVKILRTNADAHKEKRESLSPEDKDRFVKNNVAAQHKCEDSYTESLCCDSAFAHKKAYIFLNSPRGFWRSLEERSHNFNLIFFVNPN